MTCYKWLLPCGFVMLFCCSSGVLLAQQQQWFKGLWQHYQLVPDTVGGHFFKSDLLITTVSESSYAGIQRIYRSNDTTVQLQRLCSGDFKDGTITYEAGKEIRQKGSGELINKKAYENYTTDKSYFTITNNKLVLNITVKSKKPGLVKQFAYYRDLADFDITTQWILVKKYGTQQGVADYIPVVTSTYTDTDNNILPDEQLSGTDSLPADLANRKNLLVKVLTVTSPHIQLVLLDDAEIDGDIVSLYHNSQLVLSHKTLGKEVISFTVEADKQHAHHEFILVAENLGSIPPNTALMRVRAGDIKYELNVRSTLRQNVKLVINYTGE